MPFWSESMWDVHQIPDHSEPCGAVATFDAAVEKGDLDGAIGEMRFSEPYGEHSFRERVAELGFDWYRRVKGGSWRYAKRNEKECIVERHGLLENGSLAIDTFVTRRIKREWRITTAPSSKIHVVHPVLGPILYNHYAWEMIRHPPAIDHVVTVWIPGNELGPKAEHVEAAIGICSHMTNERSRICEALHSYYNKYVFGMFNVVDADGNDLTHHYAPKVTEAAKLWEMLWPPFELQISEDLDDAPWQFEIHCECQWDMEHGVDIRFKNWEVVDFS